MEFKSKVRTCFWFAAPDKEAAARAFEAMMPMRKIDIAAIEAAFDGK